MQIKKWILISFTLLSSNCNSIVDRDVVKPNYQIKFEEAQKEFLTDSTFIYGIIHDKEANSPLWYACISIPKLKLETFTDSLGKYRFYVPKGIHEFESQYVGYINKKTKKIDCKSKQSIKIDFYLNSVEYYHVAIKNSYQHCISDNGS